MSRRCLRLLFALIALGALAPALAGPPLSIDDPGILDPGQVELITAATLISTGAKKYSQVPLLDVSLGLIRDHVQVSVSLPYVYVRPDDGDSESDFGNPAVGVKWRFLNKGGLQMAIAPSYVFGLTRRAAALGIGDEMDSVVLPVNAEYQLNDAWHISGEVRYVNFDEGGDGWGYGAAVGYAMNERWQLLFELAGFAENDLDTDFLDARVGFDAAVTESVHVLFSLASGLREPSGADRLDYDIFIGVQYFN